MKYFGKQLKRARIYFAAPEGERLSWQRRQSGQQGKHGGRSRWPAGHIVATLRKQGHVAGLQSIQAQAQAQGLTPPARLYILKVLQPFQAVSPDVDQLFTRVSLWGTFPIQTAAPREVRR